MATVIMQAHTRPIDTTTPIIMPVKQKEEHGLTYKSYRKTYNDIQASKFHIIFPGHILVCIQTLDKFKNIIIQIWEKNINVSSFIMFCCSFIMFCD